MTQSNLPLNEVPGHAPRTPESLHTLTLESLFRYRAKTQRADCLGALCTNDPTTPCARAFVDGGRPPLSFDTL